MSKAVKEYVSLIYERKDLATKLIDNFELLGGWAILYPPRTEEKKEQIELIYNTLKRFVEVDNELFNLENKNHEPIYDEQDDIEEPEEEEESNTEEVLQEPWLESYEIDLSKL